MSSFSSLEDFDLQSKNIFIRVDFNIPIQDGKVIDETRIIETLPTIEYVMKQGGKVIIASHLGRPKGTFDPNFSLEPAVKRLAELLPQGEVTLTDHCIGDGATKVVRDLRDGQVAVLENLRFHPGETENSEAFAKELLKFTDVYVNEAFGVCHRAHASVSALPKLVKHRCAGFLVRKEIETFDKLLRSAQKPFVAVLGGAKVSDKLGVIEVLMDKVDVLLIGGAMANTFLSAQNISMGRSLVETDKRALARSLLVKASKQNTMLVLPEDVAVARDRSGEGFRQCAASDVHDDEMALDVGPETLERFRHYIQSAHTVFWNGPMGYFENPQFQVGTHSVATMIGEVDGFTVVGGGESVAAVMQAQLGDRFNHVSTGGGAALEYLEGKTLPGIATLNLKEHEIESLESETQERTS